MTWLIETSKIKKVLGKELKKRVDKGLDPEIAQKIANFSPAAMKAFLKTDNKGNYLIPTCALNKMNSYGGFEIKEEKSRIFNEGDVEAEISYVKNPKGKYGSCIFGSIKYTSGTICRTHDEIVNNKGVPYNTVEIRDDFNSILQISTAKNLEPLDEAVYSYRVIGNLINLDPIKQGKLSELQ